jgi:hypothetical protein
VAEYLNTDMMVGAREKDRGESYPTEKDRGESYPTENFKSKRDGNWKCYERTTTNFTIY